MMAHASGASKLNVNPLFPGPPPMRVAALMSGSGSNLQKILQNQAHGKAYRVVCILTDNPQSNAKAIAKRFGIPYEENDIAAFYRQKKRKRSDLTVRPEFDRITIAKLTPYKPDAVAYCGYMSLASPVLVNAFLGVNVHPADLRIKDNQGHRRFVGAHAVRDAILAGQKELRATTHLVSEKADQGAILMVSQHVRVRLPKGFNANDATPVENVTREHQERLKEKGDWVIFPKTLQGIAEGRFAKDGKGRLYFDGKPVPDGVDASKA